MKYVLSPREAALERARQVILEMAEVPGIGRNGQKTSVLGNILPSSTPDVFYYWCPHPTEELVHPFIVVIDLPLLIVTTKELFPN